MISVSYEEPSGETQKANTDREFVKKISCLLLMGTTVLPLFIMMERLR